MSKKAEHPKIGDCKILIEAEIAGKYFTLIQSHMAPRYDKMSRNPVGFKYSHSRTSTKLRSHYYVLWGNTPDFATMGITQLLTDKLNPISERTIVKRFFEIINAADTLTFKK
jgi:hypothetical protein